MPSTSLVVLGLVITSLAALLFDVKKAVDGTDSASTPKLARSVDKIRRARVRAKLPTEADVAERIEGTVQHSIEREVEKMLETFRQGGAGLGQAAPAPKEKI